MIMGERLNILLVEDNILNQRIVTFSLKKFNYEVVIANNGVEALEKFNGHKFDVILMDIMMPVMDGLTATKEIRSIKRDDAAQIPIIAMTANAFEEDKRDALAVGMNGHIAKPIELDKLLSMLAEVIRQQENC